MSDPNRPDAPRADNPEAQGSFAAAPGGQYAPPPHGGRPAGSNGPAIAALVLGIVALVLSWLPGINIIAVLLAIAALVTGFIGIRNANRGAPGKGMAIAGVVTGALGLILAVLILVGLATLFGNPEFQDEFQQEMERQQELQQELQEEQG
ncbi:MAG TPA: DUF4190 domain-containing protein [Egibacteraceae bacterium]|nr:DUF4190 domain-containing protein [Egibacteraceae bacterium]